MDVFLKQVLRSQKYQKQVLTKEGSNRTYIRIQQTNNSWILAQSPLVQQEDFLLRHKDFLSIGFNMMKIKALDSKRGLLLLEDLGEQDLETQILQNKKFPKDYLYSSLDQIIHLQKCQFKNWRSFTKQNFLNEIIFTETYLLQHLFKIKLNKEFRKKYLKEWEILCESLGSFPCIPAHRDFHSRNILIQNQKIYLIDFQDAGIFPRFYDILSLLYDMYIAQKINPELREKALRYFLFKGGIISFLEAEISKELRAEITITAIQRLFKACGNFAGFYILKNQKTHLKYIPVALQILETLLQEQKKLYPNFLKLIQLLLQQPPQVLLCPKEDSCF